MDPFVLLQPVPTEDSALPLTAAEVTPLTAAEFAQLPVMRGLEAVSALVVAVSGGADSLALCALLHEWCADRDLPLHAITVDHALRPESAEEAQRVAGILKAQCPGVQHVILRRDPARIAPTRLQEDARHDRYDLMRDYCQRHHIHHLCLAHHRNDQAETFLFRLAKGSGIDGLAGMRSVVKAPVFTGSPDKVAGEESGDGDLFYLRPCLDLPKERLVATCRARGLAFISDPSNENDRFARVRIRQWLAALAGEGLTVRRLAVTAQRLERAVCALEDITTRIWAQAVREESAAELLFDLTLLASQPEDIRVRILARAVRQVGGVTGYPPRLEQVEELQRHIFDKSGFTRTTLHHCLIEKSEARQTLRLYRENA